MWNEMYTAAIAIEHTNNGKNNNSKISIHVAWSHQPETQT